jgi:hypothetical protein
MARLQKITPCLRFDGQAEEKKLDLAALRRAYEGP